MADEGDGDGNYEVEDEEDETSDQFCELRAVASDGNGEREIENFGIWEFCVRKSIYFY